MDERDYLADRFEANRPHLRAVAYRMLGSVNEADDAVQEAWLRLNRSDTSAIENLGGWLTTVVARVSLDMLRSRTSRREQPLGTHVPQPIVSREDDVDPEHAGAARRLRRPCPARRPRDAASRRAARVRAARHVRRAVRRDRPDRGPLPDRRTAAREPRAAPGPRCRAGARRGRRAPARGRRRLPGGGTRRRLRRAARGPRPRRRAARRPRRPARARRGRSAAHSRGRAGAHVRAAGPLRPAGARQRTPPASWWLRADGRSPSPALRSRDGQDRRDRPARRPRAAARRST